MDYTQRQLTVPPDKLPAICGTVAALQSDPTIAPFLGSYHSGMFRVPVLDGLLWRPNFTTTYADFDTNPAINISAQQNTVLLPGLRRP